MAKLIKNQVVDAAMFEGLLEANKAISFENCFILGGVAKIDTHVSIRLTDCHLRDVQLKAANVEIYFNRCLLFNCDVGAGCYNSYYNTILVECITNPIVRGAWHNSTVSNCVLHPRFFQNLACSTYEIVSVGGVGSKGRLVVYLAKEDIVLCDCWSVGKRDSSLYAFIKACEQAYENGYHNEMQRDSYQHAIALFSFARNYHKEKEAFVCLEHS